MFRHYKKVAKVICIFLAALMVLSMAASMFMFM